MRFSFYNDGHYVDCLLDVEFAPRAFEEIVLTDKKIYRVINIRWVYDVENIRERYAFVAVEEIA